MADNGAGNAVVKRRTAEVAQLAVDNMIAELKTWVTYTTGSEAHVSILDEILQAQTVEELHKGDELETVSSKDFIGITFTFSDWNVVLSDKVGDGPDVYFSLVCHHGNRTLRVNAGGWNSVAVLYMEIKNGWWTPDVRYRFDSVEAKASGNDVIVLRRSND